MTTFTRLYSPQCRFSLQVSTTSVSAPLSLLYSDVAYKQVVSHRGKPLKQSRAEPSQVGGGGKEVIYFTNLVSENA